MGRLDDWKFCPRCAALLAREEGSVRCTACGYMEWGSSVPGAQALIERDGRVLLGRRGADPGKGLWDIPGGFLEEGEHPLAALHREIREETGLEIEPGAFLGAWMQPYWNRNVLCLTWSALPTGGIERPGDDLVELAWFGVRDLPKSEMLAFDTFVEILSLWRQQQA